MLKAAVVGLGSMGRNHARVYRELDGVELACVVDSDARAAAQVGRINGAPHYTSIEEAFAQAKPDLVSLAVPTVHHHAMARQILEAGVHTLVEKPITTSIEQAEELVDLAQAKGLVLSVGHIERFNPVVGELRRRLREGMLGRLYQIHAQRLSPYPSRIRDAGVVMDLASHDIDLMLFLTGEVPERLVGETLSSINSDREDLFNGMMRFKSGCLGVLNVNWMTPRKVRQLTLTGARGMFHCDLLSQELFFYENESGPSQWDQLSILHGVSEGNVLGIRINRYEPLRAELEDFVAAVRDRRTPTVTGRSGTDTLRVALDFVRSAQEGSVRSREAQ
jgi:UDP-N-acetylglucosamine 3-dehydrogenase